MSATTSANSGALSLSGLASGMDWTSIVNELVTVESAPLTQMQSQKTAEQNKNTGLQTIGSDLTTLQGDLTLLGSTGFYQSRNTSVANSAVASATAQAGAPLGNFTFKVNTLASDSVQQGGKASAPLSTSSNVSSLVLSSAGFSTPIKAGTFTVNGQTITVATSDTLQTVFNNISTATSGAVTGTYDPGTDTIKLASSSPITLGSATDTSNFLQASELYNNGTGTVISTSGLGGVNLNSTLASANFGTAATDGGSGNGAFTINGVTINYNASTDTVSGLLQRINSSSAGVTATYDQLNNRFDLTNNTTGSLGISMQDVTGNFLAASGLSSGTLQLGTNLTYNINGGGTLTSQSNTINAGAAGLTGLSITASGIGTTNITVGTDTATISSAITKFVSDYNTVQNYISSQAAPGASANGNIIPGMFTGNMDVENIMLNLRQTINATVSGGTGGISSLNDLGILSNGTDNTLNASNTSKLNTALANNIGAVENLFTNPTSGLATTLKTYLKSVNGFGGVISTDENNLSTEITTVSDSITNLQTKINNDKTSLTNEFTQMELAINSINQQKNLLTEYFSSVSSNSAPTAAGSGLKSGSSSSSG